MNMRAVRNLRYGQPLSRDQERNVFKDFRCRGTTTGLKTLTPEEAEIADVMIRANVGILIPAAMNFVRTCREYKGIFTPVELADFIQEGHLGQIDAIMRFEIERGRRFTTYSKRWSYTRMQNLANRMGRIPIPIRYLQKVHRALKEFEKEGREPTAEEIATRIRAKAETVKAVLGAKKGVISTYDNEGETTEVVSTLPDKAAEIKEKELIREQALAAVEKLLDSLDPRERDIVMRNFGFNGGEEESLSGIGKDYEITRERARQLFARAMGKIRKRAARIGLDNSVLDAFE